MRHWTSWATFVSRPCCSRPAPTLTGAFLAADAIDSLAVFVAPWSMGGGLEAAADIDNLRRRMLDRPRFSEIGMDSLFEADLHRYGPVVD